jgi:23S rRNA (uridine2552-2'-O)-methyltransferase
LARSASSKRWLKEHFDDYWVQKARQSGFRSRASFKLLEIQEKDGLIRPGDRVLDLGAAPGGWSQVAARLAGPGGTVIASDILPMDSIEDVTFIQGDFREDDTFQKLLQATGTGSVSLVLSDMAPNMSGMKAVDQPNAMYLAELALDMAQRTLAPNGRFLVKVFQGEGFDPLLRSMRNSFTRVVTRKPEASRPRSREVYLLGLGYRPEASQTH